MLNTNQNLSILIAYNDYDIIDLLSIILKTKYSVDIDSAVSVDEFHIISASKDHDLIFINRTFSKRLFEIIKYFREKKRGKDIPIALFIAYLSEEDYSLAEELDIFDFLSKPFSLDHIYATIDHILHLKGHKDSPSDRRKIARREKQLLVKYKINSYISPVMITKDISAKGLKVTNGHLVSINDKIRLEILLNNLYDNRPVNVHGTVRWVDSSKADSLSFGVEFQRLGVADRLRLNNTIYTHKQLNI